jgi:hypothetical protein
MSANQNKAPVTEGLPVRSTINLAGLPSNFPIPKLEWRFHPTRKWRFDYAWPSRKVALELEGGIWIRGRHNRAAGFLADMEKYNHAASLNWLVLRFQTGKMVPLENVDWDLVGKALLTKDELA